MVNDHPELCEVFRTCGWIGFVLLFVANILHMVALHWNKVKVLGKRGAEADSVACTLGCCGEVPPMKKSASAPPECKLGCCGV